jgi:hypothetical protein
MKMQKSGLITVLLMLMAIITSCSKDDRTLITDNVNGQDENSGTGLWLVPDDEVFDGGPGKDGIPAISNPDFTGPEEALYLTGNDLVLGLVVDGVPRAYPHNILDRHEIVNDSSDDLLFSVIYCPLTGTGTGWNRRVLGTITTFGVSGLLYNSNVIPYDRETGSNWSQIMLMAINGPLKGTKAETFNLFETTWATWKGMYPETLVLSENTGYNRNYRISAYGDYKTNSAVLYPVNNTDDRLDGKERVLGVFADDKHKAYSIKEFNSSISLIHDTFNGKDLVIAGSQEKNFIVAFTRDAGNGRTLQFTAVENSMPVIMQDSEGTLYDVFGQAVDGPGKGLHLSTITQFMGYWFAWAAFYPEIELY